MPPRPRRRLPLLALVAIVVAPLLAGCGSLASSPGWVGGGLALTAPQREAEAEANEAREQEILAHQPKKVGAKHILVMHKDSLNHPPDITRTREEAKRRAQACLEQLRGGKEWDELVREYSDEPNAGERGGDLGLFDRHQMVPGFTKAAFALRVGQVSELVETPFGFHIIKRTE